MSAAPSTDILGVPVSIVDPASACRIVLDWARLGQAHYVCVRDVHGVMLAQRDADFRAIHHAAGLVLPDGMPLVHVARARGHAAIARTCGPDFVDALCDAGLAAQLRHYFYGAAPGVAARMAATLAARHPGLIVAGSATPPFGAVDAAQDAALTDAIAATRPDVVWVGLSTPRQERWMRDHVGRIPGATLIGVGAAFDFHAGTVKRAPRWMQRLTLEWLYRLAAEPRRLWRRYLVLAPQFVWKIATTPRPPASEHD